MRRMFVIERRSAVTDVVEYGGGRRWGPLEQAALIDQPEEDIDISVAHLNALRWTEGIFRKVPVDVTVTLAERT